MKKSLPLQERPFHSYNIANSNNGGITPLVGLSRFELLTSSMSTKHSNQLSYNPICEIIIHDPFSKINFFTTSKIRNIPHSLFLKYISLFIFLLSHFL